MRRAAPLLTSLTLLLAPFPARAADDASPHHNLQACSVCHNEDMSLSRSKLETCTLCHAETVHGGAYQHLEAPPARVARALATRPDDKVKLPLTDDGHMWCGTCHLFHDPSISDPPWLTQGWVPPDTGLPEAVRSGVLTRAENVAKNFAAAKPDLTFADKGTRALRLPVSDGSLCLRCHGNLP
jgi:ribosomal protein L37AE/L43A